MNGIGNISLLSEMNMIIVVQSSLHPQHNLLYAVMQMQNKLAGCNILSWLELQNHKQTIHDLTKIH